MIFAIITLLSALLISSVAAYYSIIGLTALFSGAVLAVIIMGIALEFGKIVAATWLHKNWIIAPKLLKVYLTIAVFILMFITSMGIFGFLSKAHITQSGSLIEVQNQISRIDFDISQKQKNIEQEQKKIISSQKVIDQLDKSMELYFERGVIRRALREREKQIQERNEMQNTIDISNQKIKEINNEISLLTSKKFDYEQKVKNFEVEVGPIKYIADLMYGEEKAKTLLDETIRIVILILIFVFDPLAVLLIIAANISFATHKLNKQNKNKENVMLLTKQNNEIVTKTENIKVFKETNKKLDQNLKNNESTENNATTLAVPALMAKNNKKEETLQIIYKPLEASAEQINKIAETVLAKATESPLVPYNLSTNEINSAFKKIITETIEEELKK